MSETADTAADIDSLRHMVHMLCDEHARIEQQLADPEVHANPGTARRLTRRYAELEKVVSCWDELTAAQNDLEACRELADDDPGFAQEIPALEEQRAELLGVLRDLLVPRDPDDDRDALVEIRAGEGGEESALFASDLLRMYQRWADRRDWSTEIISTTPSDLGGCKDVTLAVKAKDEGAYGWLKFEGGVHRVQRVPVTESQGRIHTSAAGVIIFPDLDEPDEVQINDADLRIDVYRSSGPGGQSVNTTDSAVRITHLPTGIVASCQNEKSQLQNKATALRILRARLLAAQAAEAAAEADDRRRSQVRTVDRSERIRTYNFPENRIADHRTGYKAHNLDQVLAGDLDAVVESCRALDRAQRLEEAT